MSAKGLSSRVIIGSFFAALAAQDGMSWIPDVSMLFTSDQDSEEYKWLGQSPAMREWVGGRNAKGFTENGITIINKHYEGTIEVLKKELRRDKTGQVLIRINELARRAVTHWANLVSTLIVNGAAADCYDGQFFFDTDHSEGSSGTQSNDLSLDISDYGVVAAGVITAPSIEEMQQVILAGVAAILGFKDDQGEPMNEDAKNFLVMVPSSLYLSAAKAIAMPVGTSITEHGLPADMQIRAVMNPRLNATFTDSFPVFRTDGAVKPFIRQQETELEMKAKGDGSEFEFDEDKHQYGVDTWRNVGYGYWQHACLMTMT
jgi:phage major head subunit gpT-like protein